MPEIAQGSPPSAGDEQFERTLGTLLICGVVAAAAVVALGGIVYLARHGAEAPNYKYFQSGTNEYRTLGGIIKSVFSGRARGLVQLGILLLIATPVARVVLSLVAFLRRRDLLYAAFTLIVLGVLVFSLLGK